MRMNFSVSRLTLVLVSMLVALTACMSGPSPAGVTNGSSIDSLVGTYSVEENGDLNEFIRIEQGGSGYLMFEKQDGNWLEPVTVTPLDKTGAEAVLHQQVDVPFAGLGNDQIAIFKTPVGWQIGNFETATGYWLASVMGPIDLHKQ